MLHRFHVILIALVGTVIFTATPSLAAKDEIYTSTFSSLAVSGYDPVAYFTDGRPVKGDRSYMLEWKEATWRFASSANRDAFQADPEKYAPQYGGYCAWAVAQGYTASTDPEAWNIVDGKLYLNYSKNVQNQWQQDIPGNIVKGDANWPRVLEK